MVDAHKWVSNKVGDLEKNLGLYILKNNFFQVFRPRKKIRVCRTTFQPPSKSLLSLLTEKEKNQSKRFFLNLVLNAAPCNLSMPRQVYGVRDHQKKSTGNYNCNQGSGADYAQNIRLFPLKNFRLSKYIGRYVLHLGLLSVFLDNQDIP